MNVLHTFKICSHELYTVSEYVNQRNFPMKQSGVIYQSLKKYAFFLTNDSLGKISQ